jgi:transposase
MKDVIYRIKLGESNEQIAKNTGAKLRTVQRWRLNWMRYNSCLRPPLAALGRPHSLTREDCNALFNALVQHGWMYQDEMKAWLLEERGVAVSTSTVCRLLKEEGWSRKKIQRISRSRNEELRSQYKRWMSRFAVEDVVHLDESIFNEKTGWRFRGYAPIGDEARYSENVKRGKTWSVCGVLAVDGLVCSSVKKGYFNGADFLTFIEEVMIPTLQVKYSRPIVVVMDNCSTHISERVRELIEGAGFQLQYLPPYSPDFNPIELVWSVLKAWIRRWYYMKRRACHDFGAFLKLAIVQSECDRFARAQYSHAADGIYVERDRLEEIQGALWQYEQGRQLDGLGAAEEVDFEEDLAEDLAEDEAGEEGGDDDSDEVPEDELLTALLEGA